MQALWNEGIEFIKAIQQIRSPLTDTVFLVITFLGNELFYLVLIPLVYWCINPNLGIRLSYLILTSIFTDGIIKDTLQHPRPYQLDASIRITEEVGYGFPSNHAHVAVVLWGQIAAWSRKRLVWLAAGVLIFLIGFSRIYLGLHFPMDVLAGWVIGIIYLALALK